MVGLLSAHASGAANAVSASPLLYLLGGGVFALGLIVPGISSSFILIEMGLYAEILSAVISMDFGVLLPVALGAVLFLVFFLRIINFAFSKWHGFDYYTAIGFLLSSLFTVFPGVPSLPDICLLLLGALGAYFFMRHTSSISEKI